MSNEVKVQYGFNARRQKHKVLYQNNSGGTLTLYEGEPLCFVFDTTANINGYNKETKVEGTTTAEGYLNEGKYLIVENPADDNLQWFAGVVAPGNWVGRQVETGKSVFTDGRPAWIEVYIPNGAIVPVRAGVECTVGRTVLSLLAATQYLGHPLSANQGRAVAVAEETNAGLDTTAGLILAKLEPNLFLYQDNTGDPLYIGVGGTAPTASQCPNFINLESKHTGGYTTGMTVKVTNSGTMNATGGAAAVTGYLQLAGSITATTSYTRSILGQLDLTGGTMNGSNAHMCGVMAQINGSAATTITAVSKMAALMCDLSLPGAGPVAGDLSFIRCANNNGQEANPKYVFDIYGGYGITNLFNLKGCSNTAEDTSYMVFAGGTGSGALSTGGAWKKIRVVIEDSEYYLVALPAPTSA